MGLLRQFVVDQGYHLTDGEPTDQDRATYPKLASFTYKVGYSAYRTEFDSPIGQWLVKAHLKTYGDYPVRMRTTGNPDTISSTPRPSPPPSAFDAYEGCFLFYLDLGLFREVSTDCFVISGFSSLLIT